MVDSRTRGRLFWRQTWFSICSKHSGYRSDCNLCQNGRWSNDIAQWVSNSIYKKTPRLWRWWANGRGI